VSAAERPWNGTIVETVPHGGETILRRVAAAQRSSALVLRASGRELAARRAEREARRIAVALDQRDATERMLAAARSVHQTPAGDLRRERALECALDLLTADLGNIQLPDRPSGTLRIVTQSGFRESFIEHFDGVDDDTSACGRAAARAAQVVIADVDADTAFTPHRRIAADSRFRAVQSTPLVDAKGAVVAVFSTHFREPHRPTEAELLLFDWYVEQVGAAIAASA
jgi:GAF domain-containing protein